MKRRFRQIKLVANKDLKKFFQNPRLIVLLFLPTLIMIVTCMLAAKAGTESENNVNSVWYVSNATDNDIALLSGTVQGTSITVQHANSDGKQYLDDIVNGSSVLYIVLPDDFDTVLQNGTTQDCEVQIFYNSSSRDGALSFGMAKTAFDSIELACCNLFDVNSDSNVKYDLSRSATVPETAYVIMLFLPTYLYMQISSGSNQMTVDCIAGEKERGTLSKLLVSSVDRTSLAIGKLLSAVAVGEIGAVLSYFGVLISFSSLAGLSVGQWLQVIGANNVIFLLICIVLTVPIFVSLSAVFSANARNVQEAGSYGTVTMILSMVLSLVPAVLPNNSLAIYCIPLINGSYAMGDILAGAFTGTKFVLFVSSSLIVVSLLVTLLVKLFRSEKIMSAN